ncbi:MAG TPA: hypothetical protein VK760_15540 [Candidatus Acidoferrales bacterium]|jgi:hypothetical protein|nr:hypothetical protein [Candidatus Acidoferrales bacterium]
MRIVTRLAVVAAITIALLGIPAAVLASYVDRQWSLYTASDASSAYHLFLDPFPDARSCEVDAKIVRRNGGTAQCRSHYVLSLDRSLRDRLAWEFLSPANPFAKICGAAFERDARRSALR